MQFALKVDCDIMKKICYEEGGNDYETYQNFKHKKLT